jgi:hypothetical protein
MEFSSRRTTECTPKKNEQDMFGSIYQFVVHSPAGGRGPPESAILSKLCIVIRNALSSTIPPIENAMYELR